MLTAGHRRHDLALISALLDRGARPGASVGRALVAACTDCSRLHEDLLVLATALPVAATPPRRRDFALSAADAERLRPRGLRRWLHAIGTSRDSITRPLAFGFTTLGLAGLLMATVPAVLPGILAGTSGAAGSATTIAPQLEMQTMATPADELPGAGPDHGDAASRTQVDDPGVSPVVRLSVVFLAAGGGLFVARRSARHRSMR